MIMNHRARYILLVGALLIAGTYCLQEPLGPEGDPPFIVQPPSTTLRLDLVADLGDSLDVSVLFTPPSDPSGIASIAWRNFRVSPPPLDTISGSTAGVVDTFRVRKPAPATTDAYAIQARATDGAGNTAAWSSQHPWAVIFQDTIPPGETTIVLDTIIISGVQATEVWPADLDLIAGQNAQLYAALLFSDGSKTCVDSAASTDTSVAFNLTTWPGACDSAIARLP